jgi:hypothetical protein
MYVSVNYREDSVSCLPMISLSGCSPVNTAAETVTALSLSRVSAISFYGEIARYP